jgi:hypothetical protein
LVQAAEGAIGAGARMRRLSLLAAVESAGWILVLVAETGIGIGNGTEVDSGTRGIDDHHCLGEKRRLLEQGGVNEIVQRGIDDRLLVLGRALQHRAEKGRNVSI